MEITKRLPQWNPPTLLRVNQESVQELLHSETSLPAAFHLETRAGLPQTAWYGLPKEDYVARLIEERLMNEKELIEHLEMEYKGKHGLKEKVSEMVKRKTVVENEKLVWRWGLRNEKLELVLETELNRSDPTSEGKGRKQAERSLP
jgi:hypothetical protein